MHRCMVVKRQHALLAPSGLQPLRSARISLPSGPPSQRRCHADLVRAAQGRWQMPGVGCCTGNNHNSSNACTVSIFAVQSRILAQHIAAWSPCMLQAQPYGRALSSAMATYSAIATCKTPLVWCHSHVQHSPRLGSPLPFCSSDDNSGLHCYLGTHLRSEWSRVLDTESAYAITHQFPIRDGSL
jgi:hypothetical protein